MYKKSTAPKLCAQKVKYNIHIKKTNSGLSLSIESPGFLALLF